MAEFVKPFGPWIMGDRVSDALLERLNEIADGVLASDRMSAKLDWWNGRLARTAPGHVLEDDGIVAV